MCVPPEVNIMSVEFYPVTKAGAFRSLDWMLSRDDGRTRLVVTANPIMVMTAQRDPSFKEILEKADLLVPDGIGILWAARKKGRPLPERVTGVDLTHYLLRRRPAPRIYLLGGKPGVAERAYRNIEKETPGARICGTRHGYFGPTKSLQWFKAFAPPGRTSSCRYGKSQTREVHLAKQDKLGAKAAIG